MYNRSVIREMDLRNGLADVLGLGSYSKGN